MKSVPKIRITVDGNLALTVEQAAERYEMLPSSVRTAISRASLKPDAMLDGKKALYLVKRLDFALRDRPGKGAPGRPRPHRPAEAETA